MKKPSLAIVRGKFLNRYEMQVFEQLRARYRITAFGSMTPIHDALAFPVTKLFSPMDLPDFPYKMSVLNRIFTDAHYLFGLEQHLTGFDIAHTADTFYRYTRQCLDAKRMGHVRKVVATVWETIPFNNEGWSSRKEYKRLALRELDHIIAVTQRAKAALVSEGADPGRITVQGASVDTRRFSPAKDRRLPIHPEARDKLTILFVGRLVPEKGIREVLDAMSYLSRDPLFSGRLLTWLFVGSGSQQSLIQDRIKQIPKKWHSTIESATYDQIPSIYRRADIFIAPSKPTAAWEEQYGMALLEAQASGLPIVTTRSGGIPENVGDAAVLIPPADSRALAEALGDLLIHPKARRLYAGRARRRAVTTHDVRIGRRTLLAVYERLLQ